MPARTRYALWPWGLTLCLLLSARCHAVAMRPDQPTDPSVCDLSHQTNLFLSQRTFIPAAAAPEDQVTAYFRLAATFVATECRNGQVLILQSSFEDPIDERSLAQVASASCAVADIKRSPVPMTAGSRSWLGTEWRCTLIKRTELAERLALLESQDPFESLRARMAAAARGAAGGPTRPVTGPATTAPDCSRLSLASLLRGGSCK